MDRKIICIDTSILIDYFRKAKKDNTPFYKLAGDYDFAISVITKLEILNGTSEDQMPFWEKLFNHLRIIPLGEKEVELASKIIKELKTRNKLIDLPDILIGATALSNELELATLNRDHFSRIQDLSIIEHF